MTYRKCANCGNSECQEWGTVTGKKACRLWQPKYLFKGMDSMSEEQIDEVCKELDRLLYEEFG